MSKPNIEMLLHSAKGFAETALLEARKVTEEIDSTAIWSIAPKAIVNMNFSAELFLKFIWFHYEIEGYSRIHFLDALYEKIPDKIKLEIESEFSKRRNQKLGLTSVKLCFENDPKNMNDDKDIDNLSIEELLKLHSNSFVEWRYHFEKPQGCCIEYNFRLMFIFIQSIISVFNSKGILNEPKVKAP
ncbi:hypothetical protein [Chryseobacterium indoltheticum]|uniref:HEPN domain-containing protein n=1 Tax=Chryseobacterium indoltheticum TaxID=254 RepID=A0A3G6N2Z4_9FLAO|nr:hypothetical protein [Chryseobacterium indoltheticum]AZA60798.1 hypothetical protein EG340_06970 [Chryseobacterium indoltheticum]